MLQGSKATIIKLRAENKALLASEVSLKENVKAHKDKIVDLTK